MTKAGQGFPRVKERKTAAAKKKERRRKLLISLITIVAVGAIILAYMLLGYPNDLDDKAQKSAATAYLKDVARETNQGIRPDTSDYGPVGESSGGKITVTLVVGDCSDVRGNIESPERPKSKEDLGKLRIQIPGSNRSASHAHAVIDWHADDWATPLKRPGSGLSHCLPAER